MVDAGTISPEARFSACRGILVDGRKDRRLSETPERKLHRIIKISVFRAFGRMLAIVELAVNLAVKEGAHSRYPR